MFDWGIMQVLILVTTIYYLGFIYGILFLIVGVKTLSMILEANGYIIIPFSDLIVMNEPKDGTNSVVTFVEFGKCSFKDFQRRVYQEGICKIPKLRSVLHTFLGFMLWKEIDPQEARKNIVNCKEKITDYEELRKY